MKKLALTIAIVLGLSMTTFADPKGGGVFNRGESVETEGNREIFSPMLPTAHGLNDNQNGDSPVGSGIVLLTALGAAYLVGKKRREE